MLWYPDGSLRQEVTFATKFNTMKLPVIKHVVEFIDENDEDFVAETITLLEHMAEAPGLKDEELEVIGELISNFYGAIDVHKEVQNGTPVKKALNDFMQRVIGSIN